MENKDFMENLKKIEKLTNLINFNTRWKKDNIGNIKYNDKLIQEKEKQIDILISEIEELEKRSEKYKIHNEKLDKEINEAKLELETLIK